MDNVEAIRGQDRESDDAIRLICATVAGACLRAGLGGPDVDDVMQDVLEWLVRADQIDQARIVPWLIAVTGNFILRHRRSSWRRATQQRRLERDGSERDRGAPQEAVEARLFLDRLSRRASGVDRRLLKFMRDGCTLAEASRRAGIPEGSQQFHLRRLRERARRLASAFQYQPPDCDGR